MSTPVTFSAAELLANPLPEPKCVVGGVVVEGISGLVGRPKIGKSWLQAGVSLAVATGGRALGLPVEQGEALYLALEDTPRRLQARLATLLHGEPAPDTLTLATDWPRLNAGGIDALDRWLGQHSAARLIAIDTLAKVRPRRRPNGDLYAEDYRAVEGLKALADHFHIAIVISHHLRKLSAEDPIDTVSGTLGLTGALDAVLILQRARGRHDATLFVTGRDLEERELALQFDNTRGLWTILGAAEEYRRSSEREQIRQLILQHGPIKPKAAADLLRKNADTVRWMMADMAKRGELRVTSQGYLIQTPPTLISPMPQTPPTAPTGIVGVGDVGDGAGE